MTGGNVTGGKFITGVKDPGDKFITGVNDTGCKSLSTNIWEDAHKNSKWLLPFNQGPGRNLFKKKTRRQKSVVCVPLKLGSSNATTSYFTDLVL